MLKRSKKVAGREGTAAEGRQRALKQSKVNKLENKIQLMTVSINSTKASNASLKQKVDDLRLERINYRETLQKAQREGERRKAAVVRLNRQTTDTREQAEYVMREYEKLKMQTIEELDNFNRELANYCKIGLSGTRPAHARRKRKKLDEDEKSSPEVKEPKLDEEMKEGEKDEEL